MSVAILNSFCFVRLLAAAALNSSQAGLLAGNALFQNAATSNSQTASLLDLNAAAASLNNVNAQFGNPLLMNMLSGTGLAGGASLDSGGGHLSALAAANQQRSVLENQNVLTNKLSSSAASQLKNSNALKDICALLQSAQGAPQMTAASSLEGLGDNGALLAQAQLLMNQQQQQQNQQAANNTTNVNELLLQQLAAVGSAAATGASNASEANTSGSSATAQKANLQQLITG